jgi:hypothetical protein
MAEGDPIERVDTILESLADLGTLQSEHQGLFAEKDEEGRTFLHRLCQLTSNPVIKFTVDLCGPDAVRQMDNLGYTPLNLACERKDVSCEAIETLTRPYPQVVRISSHGGWTPLHTACDSGASEQAVRLLIHKFPDALSIKNRGGDTPLNTTCSRSMAGMTASEKDVYFEVAKLLLESCPEALSMGDNEGHTPLHIAYENEEASKRLLQLLVDRGGAKALKLLNNVGETPLLAICQAGGYFWDVIELMIVLYPKALEIVNNFGSTALHSACASTVPAGTLSVMLNRGSAACLCLSTESADHNEMDKGSEPYLPYDWAIEKEREAHVVELISNATKDAACAMMECALSSRIDMPAGVTEYVRETLTRAVPYFHNEGLSIESVRDHLEPYLTKTLANNTELQELLKKDEAYHSLIGGLVRMNKSGRRSDALMDPSNNTLAGLAVLDSISDSVDCMYLHLRENPLLCERHRSKKHPVQARGARERRLNKARE